MARRKRHTARDIPRLPKGIHCFDPTLYLRVQASGARSWIQRITVHGKQVDRGLGGWPLVTLDDVRLTALANRRAARTGHDPFTERRRARSIPTVDAVATATLDANRDGWAPATVKAWGATMRRYVLPRLGTIPINVLTRQHVIDCLTSIKAVSEARKARMRIRQICELAIARGWIGDNPGNGGIDAALPHLKAQDSTHHPAVPYASVGAIVRRLTTEDAGSVTAAALAFLILTATRSDEARGATWTEIDTAARTWTIKGARTKTAARIGCRCRMLRSPFSRNGAACIPGSCSHPIAQSVSPSRAKGSASWYRMRRRTDSVPVFRCGPRRSHRRRGKSRARRSVTSTATRWSRPTPGPII